MMDSSYFPHLAAGEIAFRAYGNAGQATDAYVSIAALLAAHSSASDVCMAIGEPDSPVTVYAISDGEARRLARVEAVTAGLPGAIYRKAADRMQEIATGESAQELAASDHAAAKRIANDATALADAFRRSDAFTVAQAFGEMLDGARDLASNAALRNGALSASHDFRLAVAGALDLANSNADGMRGSPFQASRDLADAIDRLSDAMREGSREDAAHAAAAVRAYAMELDRDAVQVKADLRDADTRAHRLNQDIGQLRAKREGDAGDIYAYRQQRDAEGARAAKAESALAATRKALNSLCDTIGAVPIGELRATAAGREIASRYLAAAWHATAEREA